MDTTYLKLRRRTWYVQVAVPRKLQGILDKKVLVKSTGTRDLVEANQLKYTILADFYKVIQAAREVATGTEAGITGELQIQANLLRHQVKAGQMDRWDAMEEFSHWLDKLDNVPPGKISPDQAKAIREAGTSISEDRTYLSDGIEAYLSSTPDLRPSTIKGRKVRLTAFQKWAGDIPMDDLTRQRAGQYVTEVLRPSGLSPSTIRQTIGILGSWYRYCIQYSHCTVANPWEGLSTSIRDTSRGTAARAEAERRVWTDDELVKLLGGINGDLLTMAVLGLYTGCRENELCEAKLVDVHDTYLRIPEAKSAAGIRSVPWHPLVVPLVEHLRDTSNDGYLVSGLKRGGYDDKRHHLFAKRFSYHKTRLKLPSSVVFHSLRYNFISQLVATQTPDSTIQQLVGHESSVLLHNTYSDGLSLEQLTETVGNVNHGKDVTTAVSQAVSGLVA